jgi:hypothetical protein
MSPQTKICQPCREVNPVDARECRSCGRFFIAAPARAAERSPADAFRHPAFISAAVLLISLVLPWFSVFMFNVTAIQVISLSKDAGGFSIRSGGLFTLTQFLFYLLPVGCIVVFILVFRQASLRLAGTVTGALPALIFLLLIIQSSQILNVMGFGFVVAILAGIGLIMFSRRES